MHEPVSRNPVVPQCLPPPCTLRF